MDDGAAEPEFERVLARAFELRDAQRQDWLEAACEEHPHLREAVSAFARQAEEHARLFRASLGHDGSVGEVFGGRYRLEERLGGGAMGIVYRARDLELERDVALKVLRADMVDPEEGTARFLREAEAMASIQHAAIITVHDRGYAPDGRPYIVMELLDGQPLSDFLDEGRRHENAAFSDDARWLGEFVDLERLDEKSYLRLATRWVADLAAGLEAVHRAGVLHRDVKPSNVFLCRSGRAVLLDFGVAARADHASLTRAGAAVGTPAYMAPESLRPKGQARPAVDVYGLTATLYHMLTLRPPYSGSATQVLALIQARDPRAAASLRPGLPRDLQAILDKGMERRPAARYASAAELERDLRAFLDYRPIAARPIPPLWRAARRLGRSKLVQGASLAALLLVLVLGARALREGYLQRRSEEYAAVARHLPPNLTIVSPANRRYRYEADRAQVALLLDRATALCRDQLPSYLLRSSFRLDHGDLEGAVADMAVVARRVDSELARELLARYRRIRSEELPLVSIPLADLPPLEADLDAYLLGYHHLRSGDVAAARELLSDPRLAGLAHAQELRLAAADFSGLTAAEEKERASRLLDEAIRLEERVGYRSAGTAHVIARMASIEGRYLEALTAAREGIALAERSHPLRITAGMMAWRLGLDDEAQLHWSIAIDLQPAYFPPYRNLMWLHLDRGELDEVEMLIDRAPFGEGDEAGQTRLAYRARVATERAMRAQDAGEREAALEHARRAESLLARARELGPLPADAYVAINDALLSDEPQGVFTGLAELLVEDPFRWRRLELALEHMPSDLDEPATRAVRLFLQALHDELASQQLVEGQR
jgi:tRNA A-37 threonylcarbamoyl transferase component Bud32